MLYYSCVCPRVEYGSVLAIPLGFVKKRRFIPLGFIYFLYFFFALFHNAYKDNPDIIRNIEIIPLHSVSNLFEA